MSFLVALLLALRENSEVEALIACCLGICEILFWAIAVSMVMSA